MNSRYGVFGIAIAILTSVLPAVVHAQCDAWFRFDGDLSDSSGNGNGGTVLGVQGAPVAPQFATGVIGQALQLDGKSAMRADVGLSYDACPQITVTAWIRVESIDAGKTQFLISTGPGSGPGLWTSDRLAVLTGTENGLLYYDALRDGRAWFFFAGVYDYQADTYRLHWRDRVVEGTLSAHRRPPEGPLWVGAYNDDLHYAIERAWVDELRITGRALTAAELERMRGGRRPALVLLDGAGAAGGELSAGSTPPDTGATEPAPDDDGPLLELPVGAGMAAGGATDPQLTAPGDLPGTEAVGEYDRPPGVVAPGATMPEREPFDPDRIGQGLVELDYEILQVNSTVAGSRFIFGTEIPLAVRVRVNNASDESPVVFYAAIGEPGSDDAVVITPRYESTGDGPHIVSLKVPLAPPLVDGGRLDADLFLIGEKRMPGLPGQTVGIQVPIDDPNPDNHRMHLDYEVHDRRGYVLTHEHPTYGMAFGGNYAFAGAADNYRHGIMQEGYTAACAGCLSNVNGGTCDHGEFKGKMLEFYGSLGRDVGLHLSETGPFHSSFSHLRYSSEWIEEAFRPTKTEFEDARMRIMIAFAVENEAMCEQLYYANQGGGGPGGDGYPCSRGDSFDSLKRQLDNLKAWAAENGSWMEIAYTAADARRIVYDDKLAIILGVEAEYAFGAEDRKFDPVDRLDEFYDEGVRTFYLAHKINSRLAGADIYFPADTDPGKAVRVTQALSGCFYFDDNIAHFPLEGRLGNKLCDNNCGANAFKGGKIGDGCAYKLSEISEANMVDYVLTRGGGQFNGFKLYPWTPGFGPGGSTVDRDGIERNNLALSNDGERVVRAAMMKGMIVNIDHVSSKARDRMNEIATAVFDEYPLNALHNKPNRMLSGTKGYMPHEYDLDDDELKYIRDTGGFFGFRMGPTDSIEYPDSGVSAGADCKTTSTESAKMLAWLLDQGHQVGYALDFATNTQGVNSRTLANCALNLGKDWIHEFDGHVTEGISHVGTMRQWHRELEEIGLAQKYVDRLKFDGVEAFLAMWEQSEAAAGTGSQVERTVVVLPVTVH